MVAEKRRMASQILTLYQEINYQVTGWSPLALRRPSNAAMKQGKRDDGERSKPAATMKRVGRGGSTRSDCHRTLNFCPASRSNRQSRL
jgi:hypothetical protein